jgi:hypothetical protein
MCALSRGRGAGGRRLGYKYNYCLFVNNKVYLVL